MLKCVMLKNWKTHLSTEIKFSEGVNCLLGPMGSGKSSVLEAICFALFGNTPSLQSKKISVSDLIMKYPTKKDEAEVKVVLEINGKEYEVLRKVSVKKGTYHSEVRENGVLKKAPQSREVTEYVESLLGVDYEMFSQIIYGEQNRIDFFLGMQPKKRKERFDEILKIDKLERARSNLTTLINSIKRDISAKKDALDRMKHDLLAVDVEKLRKELETKRKELASSMEKLGDIERKLSELKRAESEMKKKKEQHDSLLNEIERMKGELSRLKKEIDSHELAKEIEKRKKEDIEKELKNLLNLLEELEMKEKKIMLLSSENERLAEDIQKLKKEIDEFERAVSKLKPLESIESELKNLEKRQEEVVKKIERIRAIIEEEKKAIDALERAEARCPVCETELDAHKKERIIVSKKNKIENLRKEISELNMLNKTLLQELTGLKEERDKALAFKSKEEQHKKNLTRVKELENEMRENEKKLKSLKAEIEKEDKEKLNTRTRSLEKLLELIGKKDEAEKLEKLLNEKIFELGKIEFDEKELEKLEKNIREVLASKSSLEERINGLKALISEKESRMREIENMQDMIEELEKEIRLRERAIEELEKFRVVVEKSQLDLREEFVAAVNYQMSQIWDVLYPYGDYRDIKVFPDEDYALKLLNTEGLWVDAESFVSGGERMTAALTLRLALASILTPKLRVMILDEPTHNLDTLAIEELGRTLRERMSEIMEQVVLITHDELLAESASMKLYRFERGEEKRDVTRVTEVK